MFIFSIPSLMFLSNIVFGVGYIQSSNLFPEPLNQNEERIYLEKMKNGDITARNILIERNLRLVAHIAKCIENEILMYLRSNKKRVTDVYLNEPIGKDKDDNEVTLQEVLENNDRNVEDEVDLKLKVKQLYEKMKKVLKDREKIIIELRFGLNGEKPKTQKEIAKMMNISRSYVSRIESKAISKLSTEIDL